MANYKKLFLTAGFGATVELERPPAVGKTVKVALSRTNTFEDCYYRTIPVTLLSGTVDIDMATGTTTPSIAYSAAVAQTLGHVLTGTVTTAGTIVATVNLQNGLGNYVVSVSAGVTETASVIRAKIIASLNRVLADAGWVALQGTENDVLLQRYYTHLKGHANIANITFTLALGTVAGLTRTSTTPIGGAVGVGTYIPPEVLPYVDSEGLAIGGSGKVGFYVTTNNQIIKITDNEDLSIIMRNMFAAATLSVGSTLEVSLVSSYAEIEFTFVIYLDPS